MDMNQVKSCETFIKFSDLVKGTEVYIGRKLITSSSNQSHYQYLVWIPEDINFVPQELTYWSITGLNFLLKASPCPVLYSSRKASKRYNSYVKALQR